MDFLVRVLDPEFAISAVAADGQLLGMAGFKTCEGAFVSGGLRDLAVSYGWFGAIWRGILLQLLDRESRPDQLLMDGLFVRETARGQGVGSALLDRIFAEAKRQGLQGVRLDVIDINPRARAPYEHKGFQPTETTRTGPLQYLFGFQAATTMIRPVRNDEVGYAGRSDQ